MKSKEIPITPCQFKPLLSDLPIFYARVGGQVLFYTPGRTLVAEQKDFSRIAAILKKPGEKTSGRSAVYELLQRAHRVQQEFLSKTSTPFSPRCLTITVGNRCNLHCPYCFSKEFAAPFPASSRPTYQPEVIKAAARVVADHCRENGENGEKFNLVVHGGGEPTMFMPELKEIMNTIRMLTGSYQMELFSYIATNGVVSDEVADWLMEHFSLIGLSCDGPPNIQDRQRPLPGPIPSSALVERFARRMKAQNKPFHVRVTITPGTMADQVEIVEYARKILGAEQVRFEPVYRMRGDSQDTGPAFLPVHAPVFVHHFLAAQAKARELGCQLSISGVRPGELHGPHCNILKNVLQLIPGGVATACFLYLGDTGPVPAGSPWVIGQYNRDSDEFLLDREKIAERFARMSAIPERCSACFNRCHCARLCPEYDPQQPGLCPAPAWEDGSAENRDFRCLVQMQLAEAWILQSVRHLLHRGDI